MILALQRLAAHHAATSARAFDTWFLRGLLTGSALLCLEDTQVETGALGSGWRGHVRRVKNVMTIALLVAVSWAWQLPRRYRKNAGCDPGPTRKGT